jgi:NADH:ubiquinone oxidoreductase subunit 6 (subunit J)
MLLKLILFISYLFLFIFAVIQETTFSMVFSLILVFLVACFLVISLGFEFLGYLILIVYVGAIAVLFLFMVMLFDRSEYKMFGLTSIKESKSLIIVMCLLFAMAISILFFDFIFDYPLIRELNANESVKFLSYTSDAKNNVLESNFLLERFFITHQNNVSVINISDIELLGLSLYTDFFIPLLLAGFGLLVAMIGCIILTRTSFLKKKFRKTQIIEDQLNRFKL